MIKINKDINNIPESLKPATNDFFLIDSIPPDNINTHSKRMLVIENKAYDSKYNDRYKIDEIKKALNNIYHHKCAFCEQRVEQIQVEHYRPKKKRNNLGHSYYWLAFSWDNLLVACPTCNTNKSTHFEIEGRRASFINNAKSIRNINSFSTSYNNKEKPLIVNPEVTDPKGFLIFSENGKVSSIDKRFKHTIENVCKLDRSDLNDQRRKIIDDLKNDIRSELLEKDDVQEQAKALEILIRSYKRRAENIDEVFLAFRQYSIDNHWMNNCIKDITHRDFHNFV